MTIGRTLRLSFAACAALFVLAWVATPLPHGLRVGAIDLLWLAAALLAGAAALWAGRQPGNAALRRSLCFAAAGALAWAAGQAVWTYQEIVQGVESPVFGLADAGFAISLPFLAGAIVSWPRDRIRWTVGTALDLALVAGLALFFGVELILQPLLGQELEGAGIAYAVAYPPAEILLLGLLVAALLLNCWHERPRLELLSLGLLCLVAGDAGYAYLADAYATGGLLDPLWLVGFTAVGCAALARPDWRERRGWVSERVVAVVPSAGLFLLGFVGIAIVLAGRQPLGSAHRVAIFALVVLLAARQGYTQLRLLDQMGAQRRLEQQLQHSQKLEAVGRLAGGVAHDFNNLLTAIDGYSDLALHQLADGHPVRRDIDEVRRAAQRAAELTRQLLAFSRRQVLTPQVVDVNAIVGDADRMLRRLIGEQIALDAVLAPEPALVDADPGQLEQVITNLVVNARDAMPDGGTVRIETEVRGDRVHVVVSDDGVGMNDETRARAFEPFFTTKDVGAGTGLGLAMVHGIVAQSGGEIAVSSTPGGGARFEIVLPAAAAVAVDIDRPVVSIAAGRGSGTVLVVEDEPAVRELARRMLELAGFGVVTAASGEEAARLFGELGSIDLLLTDIAMPGMNGHELASRLRGDCPQLRVVLMSGYSQDAEALDRLLAAGAGFVEKPFTSSALVSEVRGVLDAAA